MRVLGLLLFLVACGGGDDPPDNGVTTERCEYVPLPPTGGAGGSVTAGPLTAGAAERVLHVPVGTALGGYTGRAQFLSSAGTVDARKIPLSGTFNPSIGVTNAPRVKALALTAGGETVLILKGDMIFAYEGMLFDIEEKLGPEFAGKVILATSHSHSAWAQFTGHAPLKLGSGELRNRVYSRFIEAFEGAARDALAARVPARLGIFSTSTFDPSDAINRDRRGENNDLPGGARGDDHMVMLRVDEADGDPIAMVPIFGQHPTINDQDNPFATGDATGQLEHLLEEQFDRPVVVMHLQSAGADTSAVGHGGVDCNNRPGKMSDPCFGGWTSEEGHGHAAVGELMQAWMTAGGTMKDSLELEMVTRSIETGPHAETFTIRNGALAYAPFDPKREVPDGIVMEGNTLKSPIDEFNAQVGAGLCETAEPMFPAAAIPGTEGILPYGSCLKLDTASEILGPIFNIDFGVDATHPVCETTRTTISALRIDDFVFGTLPGEVSVLIADLVREKSPAPGKAVVIGYSQGHVGYMLRPEDWILGGYEPSVTFWGPLEAEYIVEELLELMPLVQTPARENAVDGGTTRVATARMTDTIPVDDPAPMAGTIPNTIPPVTWSRTGTPAQAQPQATIPRVSGIATFTWIGDDPQVKTPKVTLEMETAPGSGNFQPVVRRSGRRVVDTELVLAYTPSPLQRGSGPQTHVWVVEWQAVPWAGLVGAETLADRGGVTLARYRFAVEGNGWSIASQAFTVQQGGLSIGAVTRSNNQVRVPVRYHAPKGFRLLDMQVPSNQPVPVRSQTVTITLRNAAGVQVGGDSVTTDANGNATVADAATATMAQVTDRFGNTLTVPIP